jgi:hypothetical protein
MLTLLLLFSAPVAPETETMEFVIEPWWPSNNHRGGIIAYYDGSENYVEESNIVVGEAQAYPTAWWYRAFFQYFTSAIPDDAIIDSAKFYVYTAEIYSYQTAEGVALLEEVGDIGDSLELEDWDAPVLVSYGTFLTPSSPTNTWLYMEVKDSISPLSERVTFRMRSSIEDIDTSNTRYWFYDPGIYPDYKPYLEVTYTYYPPNPPTNLLCEGETDPTQVVDNTPEFSAIYTDNTLGDNATHMEIWVGTSPGDNSMWASDWIDITDIENNSRSENVEYAGSFLVRNVLYFWQCRFKDAYGRVGGWSSPSTFFLLPIWESFETWSSTVGTRDVGWGPVEVWTTEVRPLVDWRSAELWTGEARSGTVAWRPVESWSCEIASRAVAWRLAEAWTAEVRSTGVAWCETESWDSLFSAPVSIPILLSPENGENINPILMALILDWDNSQPADNFLIQIDNDPNFSSPENQVWATVSEYSLTLQDNLWWWRVMQFRGGENSGWSGVWSFRVDTSAPEPPVLVNPSNGTNDNDNTPELSWQPLSENSLPVAFRVFVSRYQNFTDTVFLSSWITGTSIVLPQLEDNLYYWKVKARDNAGNEGGWSLPCSFRVDTTPPKPPMLLSPADGDWAASQAQLSWQPPDENSFPLIYLVQISDTPDFSTVIENSGWIASTSWITSQHAHLSTWYWRIKARDNAGNEGEWSENWAYTVDDNAPTQVALSLPANGATLDSTSVTLSWSDASDAESGVGYYELWVNGNVHTVAGTSKALALAEGTHSWRVRAVDVMGNAGGWSATWSFTVSLSPEVEAPDETSPTLELLDLKVDNAKKMVEITIRAWDTSGIDENISVFVDNAPTSCSYENGVISVSISGLEVGKHLIVIWVNDIFGNLAELSVPFSLGETYLLFIKEFLPGSVGSAEVPDEHVYLIRAKGEEGLSTGDNTLEIFFKKVKPDLEPQNLFVHTLFEAWVKRPEAIDWVEMYFRVEEEWIENVGAAPEAVSLFRFENEVWRELQTQHLGENGGFAYYLAKMWKFSLFAVGIRPPEPSFALLLPPSPLPKDVEQLRLGLVVVNYGRNTLHRFLRLEIEGNVMDFEIRIAGGENDIIYLFVPVENLGSGEHSVALFDARTNVLLTQGGISIGADGDTQPTWLLLLVLPLAIATFALLRARRPRLTRRPVARVREVPRMRPRNLADEYWELLVPLAKSKKREKSE